jgi:hypothetical protein
MVEVNRSSSFKAAFILVLGYGLLLAALIISSCDDDFDFTSSESRGLEVADSIVFLNVFARGLNYSDIFISDAARKMPNRKKDLVFDSTYELFYKIDKDTLFVYPHDSFVDTLIFINGVPICVRDLPIEFKKKSTTEWRIQGS